MELSLSGSTADERVWMVSAASDTEPGERYLYNRDTKTLTKQYEVFEKLPREHLANMKPIRYKSSDGLEIPAYLVLPKGTSGRNLPLLVVPHGGPWARDTFGYNSMAQFFANRGYAVLLPNFRSSTGYGKTFLNAGNNEWGQKMQDDITWGVKHLVSAGNRGPQARRDPRRLYGGYAALAGVAFTPDVYAAAVSIVGPSNLLTLLDSIPPYWDAGRKMFHKRMGDPTTPEGKQQLERQSPLISADKIKTPLFVVQGANDPRVKQRGVRPDRRRAPRSQVSGRVHRRPRRRPRLRASRQQHGDVRGGREVSREAPRRTLPGEHDARGLRAPQGDHGRSEDRGARSSRSTRRA